MNLIIKDAKPPLLEVAKLKGKCSQVYALMWESASKDVRVNRGGTTRWSIKGMANVLSLNPRTIKSSLCRLLDGGFIQVIGYVPSSFGKNHTLFRVTHPNQLDAVRHSISVIGSPCEAWNKRLKRKGHELYQGEVWDIVDGYDPSPVHHYDPMSWFKEQRNNDYYSTPITQLGYYFGERYEDYLEEQVSGVY